ncbi:hypothetical protein HNP33_001837 [Comamonas odontotermitis]|uniref:Uncharacterized protein n=1 Tax=Comamonas odontotermitis TaxID=379895 RepID=A0ABR6RFI2_9BURK|nr:hypothetical protein [Comamonas odontotermitis]
MKKGKEESLPLLVSPAVMVLAFYSAATTASPICCVPTLVVPSL